MLCPPQLMCLSFLQALSNFSHQLCFKPWILLAWKIHCVERRCLSWSGPTIICSSFLYILGFSHTWGARNWKIPHQMRAQTLIFVFFSMNLSSLVDAFLNVLKQITSRMGLTSIMWSCLSLTPFTHSFMGSLQIILLFGPHTLPFFDHKDTTFKLFDV